MDVRQNSTLLRQLIILSFITLSIALKAQTNIEFRFFDSCLGETIELDYNLWYPNSTIQVEAGQKIKLEEPYYILTTQIKADSSNWIATFGFDILMKNLKNINVLYLNKIRSKWNGLLHPQLVEFYFCDEICNGKIEEQDSTGTVRAIGNFENGTPTSNIKFYDELGRPKEKWIIINGNLKRIKKY